MAGCRRNVSNSLNSNARHMRYRESMVVSNSSVGNTRPTYRKGSADSAAMQSLVPGDHQQTEQDLALFPQPVLDMLDRYGTRVAILRDGQTLAESEALRTLSDSEVAEEARKTNGMVSKGVEKAFRNGITSYDQLEAAGDAITRNLRDHGIDNYLATALSPFPLDALAEAREIPADKISDWKAAFWLLNEGLVTSNDESVKANSGLIVLPHTYHQGKAVPELRLRSAGEVTAEFVEGSLGLNRSDDRLVLLHEKFLANPASELGNYRLAVHEIGHALDHVLEQLTNFPGFGALHRQTVDALYENDQAKVAAGATADSVFTSDRADDDVREYFAEAVEAYLTPENPDGNDNFRAGNSREGLVARNPELFAYVEKIMTTDFGPEATAEPPKRSFAPPGFPDPDLEVVRVS